MNKPDFTYNNPSASCVFCDRTGNPHPDFQHEPIVTTRLIVNQNEQEVCINCYCEIAEIAKAANTTVTMVTEEKINLLRILNRQPCS
jgi:hypothetical protein